MIQNRVLNGEKDNHIDFCIYFCSTIESYSNKSIESHSPINTEFLVDSAIHVAEENHEEDNLSIDNNADYNLTNTKSFRFAMSVYFIRNIQVHWQPPE